ncbi:MAG: hypothetical protein WKH64_07055 [Chloroflexia bacterium]
MHSVAVHYGFDLETPFEELPPEIVEVVFYGTRASDSRYNYRLARRRATYTRADSSGSTA